MLMNFKMGFSEYIEKLWHVLVFKVNCTTHIFIIYYLLENMYNQTNLYL